MDKTEKENNDTGSSTFDKSAIGGTKFNVLDNQELSRTPTKPKTPLADKLDN